jgi:ATP diphosphatase
MTQLNELLHIMQALRDPQTGCPWDKKQTFDSVVSHTIEEAYEVADAIERKDFDELKGELGDLLFQVVFYSQMAKEQGRFDFNDVVETLNEKLIRRHPHVFDSAKFKDEDQIHKNWEKEKEIERAMKAEQENNQQSVLDNIPLTLPALSRAYKIQKRCANVGFDWEALPPVVDKIKEELGEVLAEVNRIDLTDEQKQLRIEDELGDLLFANVNLVRHLKCDPEQILRQGNKKFSDRFRLVEKAVKATGKELKECDLAELEAHWVTIKNKSC